MKKSQSSTEYLVLFAISVILLSILILAFIDVPLAQNANDDVLQTSYESQKEVGLVDYIYSSEGIHVLLANNGLQKITINNIEIDGINQSITGLPKSVPAAATQLFTWYTDFLPSETYDDDVTLFYCVGGCLKETSISFSRSGTRVNAYLTAAIDSSEMLSNYLTLYLPFDNDFNDHSRYGQNVTVLQSPQLVQGTFGNRLLFNTSGNQFYIEDDGNSLDIADTRNHSVVFWLESNNSNFDFVLFQKNQSDTAQYSLFAYSLVSYLDGAVIIKDDGPSDACNSFLSNFSDLPSINENIMITITLESEGQMRYYYDDSLRGEDDHTSCSSSEIQYINVTGGDIFLFNSQNGGNTYIDEYMIFNKSLTSGEVRSLYQRGAN